MNHVVACKLLYDELAAYRDLDYDELQSLIGDYSSHRKLAEDGVEYEISVKVRWRFGAPGDIRIIGFVGEAAWGGPHNSVDDTIIVSRPVQERP
jgi:hypothetical protein